MKYTVGGAVQGSTYIGEIEASSPEEAFDKAYKKAHVSVCHQCAEHIEDPEVCELWAEDENGVVTHEPSEIDAARRELAELKEALEVAELDDWREWGMKLCPPPITCDADMRQHIGGKLSSADWFESQHARAKEKLFKARDGWDAALKRLREREAELEARAGR